MGGRLHAAKKWVCVLKVIENEELREKGLITWMAAATLLGLLAFLAKAINHISRLDVSPCIHHFCASIQKYSFIDFTA